MLRMLRAQPIDGTSPGSNDSQDDAVAPGDTFEYIWDATPESGPGPNDLDSKLWMHCHVLKVFYFQQIFVV